VGEDGGVYELLQLQMRSLPASWTQQLIGLTRFMESEDRYIMHSLLSPFLLIPGLGWGGGCKKGGDFKAISVHCSYTCVVLDY
jgi:hypothetical protein